MILVHVWNVSVVYILLSCANVYTFYFKQLKAIIAWINSFRKKIVKLEKFRQKGIACIPVHYITMLFALALTVAKHLPHWLQGLWGGQLYLEKGSVVFIWKDCLSISLSQNGSFTLENIGFVLNILSWPDWICQFSSTASIGQPNIAWVWRYKEGQGQKSQERVKCVHISPQLE